MMAWEVLPSSAANNIRSQIDPHHRLSMSYTRYHLLGATLTEGERLFSNYDSLTFKMCKHTFKVYDMTFMSCNPPFYASHNLPGRRNCASNIAEATEAFGMRSGWKEVSGGNPFDCFQNTPFYALKGGLGSSRAGILWSLRRWESVWWELIAVHSRSGVLMGRGSRMWGLWFWISECGGEALVGWEREEFNGSDDREQVREKDLLLMWLRVTLSLRDGLCTLPTNE